MSSEMKRLKQLEDENGRLKRIIADLTLDRKMLQEVISESFRACPASSVRGSSTDHLTGQHPAGVRSFAGGTFQLYCRAPDVVMTLDRAALVTGYPRTIRVGNGPEFVSRDLDLWAFQHGVTLDFSRPGKPTDNAFAESFNGKVRAECLNTAWLLLLDDARRKCETWRRDYNEERPHSSIGDKCPIEIMNGAGPYGPPGA